MKLIYFLFLSIIFSLACVAQITFNLADSFQICINNHIQNNRDKGISAAIIMPNGGVWTGAAGIGKNSLPIQTTTPFYCASTSKTFVAANMMKLVETNSININAPIYHYLVSSQYPSAYIDSTITIKQLLNHTSGIYNFTDNSNFFTSVTTNPTKAYAHGECLFQFLNQGPTFPKGTGFNYSNSNYVLLAFILEKATGADLKDIIYNNIIQPLNLNATSSSDDTTPNSPAGFCANTGLFDVNLSNIPHTALLTSMWGPAHMVSIPENLAHYCRALIKGQLYTQPTTITDMLTVDPLSIDATGYGLGIERYKFAGNNLFGHTGNLGHITYMFHSPTDDYTIVTMTNRFAVGGSDNILAFKALEKIVLRHLAYPLSVSENYQANSLGVYPNPAQNTISITGIRDANATIILTDVFGKEIVQSKQPTIDITEIANGVYFLNVIQNNHSSTQKIIVNH